MQENPFNWDEYQWERFLRMQERRHETFMLAALRSRNPWRLGSMWSGAQLEPIPDEAEQIDFLYDEIDGDEWKITSHPCYREVCESLEYIQQSLDALSVRQQSHVVLVEVFARSYSIPTFLAIGIIMEHEYRCEGGAIAYCKRALYLANELLDYLKEIGNDTILSRDRYLQLFHAGTRVRNTIGCYISDLRWGDAPSPIA